MSEERKGSYERIAPDGLQEGVIEVTAELSAKVHRLPTSLFASEGLDVDMGVVSRMKVSTAFVALLAKAMAGESTEYGYLKLYKYHTWGTDSTAEANTQHAVIAPVECSEGLDPSGYTSIGTQVATATSYSSVATMTATGSITVYEHCLVPYPTDITIHGLDRSKVASPGIALGVGDSVTWTYTLNIPAET